MERRDFVLAVLSAGHGCVYTPVQVQKLFFLIDRNIAKDVGGPHFNFRPYAYGPFDAQVYAELESLAAEGLAQLGLQCRWRTYALTPQGQELGSKHFQELPARAHSYICEAVDFVRRLPFTKLVAAIYKQYPEMRKNSVFRVPSDQ